MLDVLMDGRAWTGRELARAAHVTASTASEHLQRLVNGDLLSVVQQGRFRYYRIASPEVAYALEALMDRTAARSRPKASIFSRSSRSLSSPVTLAVHCAARAWIGASAGCTWPDGPAPRSRDMRSNAAGFSGKKAAAPLPFRKPGPRRCAITSRFGSGKRQDFPSASRRLYGCERMQ